MGSKPSFATSKEKAMVKRLATRYVLLANVLYKRSFDGVLLRCLDDEEVKGIPVVERSPRWCLWRLYRELGVAFCLLRKSYGKVTTGLPWMRIVTASLRSVKDVKLMLI